MIPWYDGHWLDKYYKAKGWIQNNAPHKLKELEESINHLRTNKHFKPIRLNKALTDKQVKEAKRLINDIDNSKYEKHEILSFGRVVVHNDLFFIRIQESLIDMVSSAVDEELEISYNFLSLYSNIGVCPMHMDAPDAKWTLDICLDQSYEWPIYFSQIIDWPDLSIYKSEDWEDQILNDQRLHFESHTLRPGNGIIFSGSSQFHYINRIHRGNNNDFCNLIFFHFIPKHTKDFINPKSWPEYFNLPSLSQAFDS